MIRGLVLVAFGGAALSAASIGASGAWSRHHWHLPVFIVSSSDSGDGPLLALKGDEKTGTRSLAWSGGETLSFDLPAQVTYTQGPAVSMVISGPEVLLAHVVLHGDTLRLDRNVRGLNTHNALSIAISGPSLHEFRLNSALTLDLRAISTDSLSVRLDGAGKVMAQGSAHSVMLRIDGAGDADLGKLAVSDADIRIDGIGHVVAAPTRNAEVRIAGAGKVTLLKRPQHLRQEIEGAGSIDQPDQSAGEGQSL
jgi:hypothetical protein